MAPPAATFVGVMRSVPFLLFCGALLTAPAAQAQRGLSLGLIGGPNLSRFTGDFIYHADYHVWPGFAAGLTTRYGLSDRLALRLDARFTQRNVRVFGTFRDLNNYSQGDTYIRRRFNSLDLPLLAQVGLGAGQRAYLLAGPVVSVLLRQTDVFPTGFFVSPSEYYPTDFTAQTRRLNLGALVGAGLTQPLGPHWCAFAELTYTLTTAQVLRPAFSIFDNRNGQTVVFGPRRPEVALSHVVALQAGICYALRAAQ